MKKYILVVIENYDDLDANVSLYDTFEEAKKKLNESYESTKRDRENELVLDTKSEGFYHIIQEGIFDTYEAKAFIEEKEI